jgi:hypothetical protein
LAAAVCGFPVTVVPGVELFTDGTRIVIPYDEHVTDGLAVQASLLAIESFPRNILIRLAARPGLRSRYLVLESRRAAHEYGDLLPPRTVRRILDAYDGPIPQTCHHSLELSISGRRIPEAPAWMGVIKPGKILVASGGRDVHAPHKRDIDGSSDRAAVPEHDNDESQESALLKLLQAPVGGRNPLMNYVQKLLGISRAPGQKGVGGGEEMAISGDRTGKRPTANGIVVAGVPPVELMLDFTPSGRRHPEWNCHTQQYRSDWCTVTEYTPRPLDEAFEVSQNIGLRRELARIGVALERHRRQADGDVIDLAEVINRQVDRRTGFHDGDDRVYERRLRTAHDLGVLILLDATGSTGESETGRRIFDEQRLIAAQLTAEFEALAVRVAIYGFQSWGRQNVQFLRVKAYDDRYDRRAAHRLGALDPGGFTRLGAAIRHGSHIARNQSGAAANLLVAIGDGLPYDDGYEHRYAQEDCQQALVEATEAGVGCACISVRTATEPAELEKVWGSVPHQNLDEPAELVARASLLFQQALQGAAASRRRIS